ncbi:MAG: acyl-CoA dehydrogenase family protein [Myxococcota bacterium]
MDLEFTEEQDMLRETVRRVCAEHAPLDVVRAMETDPKGYPPEFWKQLAELGILGIRIPEEHGGTEMSLLDSVIVYEEFGRSLVPTPHFVSAVLSAGLLLSAGREEQQQEWLPRIASGEAILSPAWLEPDRGYGASGVQLGAEVEGDGFRLSGTKRHVHFVNSAARLIVLARTGEDDIGFFLVDPDASGVRATQQQSLASDTQFRVDFDGVRVSAGDRIGAGRVGWAEWHAVMLDAIVLAAAQAMGGAAQALDITCKYAVEREQFGKPLAAFQAISHYLADAATAVSGGSTLVHEAAWARSQGKSIERLAPMAKLFACQTYRDLTAMAEQVWGGVGFTIEYDIQLYFRRAKQLQLSWWDTRYLEELVASSVLDGSAV